MNQTATDVTDVSGFGRSYFLENFARRHQLQNQVAGNPINAIKAPWRESTDFDQFVRLLKTNGVDPFVPSLHGSSTEPVTIGMQSRVTRP